MITPMQRKKLTSRIDTVHAPTLSINERPFLVHQTQILRPHPSKTFAVRVDPEVIGIDWVSDSDVASGAFVVVTIHAEPAKCRGVVEFAKCTFGFQRSEARDSDVIDRLGFGIVRCVGAIAERESGLVDRLSHLDGLRLDCGVGPGRCGI